VWLREGRVTGATLNDKPVQPLKAVARLLTWPSGAFHLVPEEAHAPSADLSAESLLLEALRQYDEAQPMLDRFGDPQRRVRLAKPIEGRLSTLSPLELDALQIFLDVPVLGSAYEAYAGTDFELVTLLSQLVDKRIVVVV
jgi:hypothetical protein